MCLISPLDLLPKAKESLWVQLTLPIVVAGIGSVGTCTGEVLEDGDVEDGVASMAIIIGGKLSCTNIT